MARTQGEPENGGSHPQKVAGWGGLTQATTPWGYRAGEELPGYPSCMNTTVSTELFYKVSMQADPVTDRPST